MVIGAVHRTIELLLVQLLYHTVTRQCIHCCGRPKKCTQCDPPLPAL